MNLYEGIFIGRQDLSQQQMDALGVNLGLFVTQNGGEVVRGEYCGFRSLAYPIKKNHKGHYYIIQMKTNGEIVIELDRVVRINEDVIRHLFVKVDKFDDRENLITQAKILNDDYVGKDTGYRNTNNRTNVVEAGDETSVEKNDSVDVAVEG